MNLNRYTFNDMPPPKNKDVLFKLANGKYGVGRLTNSNDIIPTGIEYTSIESLLGTYFESPPIQWTYLP